MSEALVQENGTLKDDKKTIKQVSVYFASEALAGSKTYYSEMEKMLCSGYECQKALSLF
jgi:hypothetical protein